MGSGIVANYTDDLIGSGTATADDVTNGAVAQAVDNNNATSWATANSAFPHWFKYDFGVGTTYRITKLTMTTITVTGGTSVKDFTLRGSNNDSDWDVVTTEQHTNVETINTFTFTNTTAYRYYKINVTTNWGSQDIVGMREVEMMETIRSRNVGIGSPMMI